MNIGAKYYIYFKNKSANRFIKFKDIINILKLVQSND
jgi:hypothetical protein